MTTDITGHRTAATVPAPRQSWQRPDSLGGAYGPSRSGRAAGRPAAEPSNRRLLGLCGWAALLGVVGMVIGIRGLILILATHQAAWFEPALILVGLSGVALTSGAFLTVHQRYVPWLLLGAASGALIGTLVITATA